MAKSQAIFLRVDAPTKDKLTTAARRAGVTLTDFILESASRAADRVEADAPEPLSLHDGLPRFFRQSCERARRGGRHGYEVVGYEMARHLPRLLADKGRPAAGEQGREEGLEALSAALGGGEAPNRGDVLRWFLSQFPDLMRAVPRKRYDQFISGVCEHQRVTSRSRQKQAPDAQAE